MDGVEIITSYIHSDCSRAIVSIAGDFSLGNIYFGANHIFMNLSYSRFSNNVGTHTNMVLICVTDTKNISQEFNW